MSPVHANRKERLAKRGKRFHQRFRVPCLAHFFDRFLCHYDPKLEQPAPNDGREIPSLDLGLDLMKENVAHQMSQADAVDVKAGFILGSASLLTGVLAVWRTPPASAMGIVQTLPAIVLVVYAGVVLLAGWTYLTRPYRLTPDPVVLRDKVIYLEEQQAQKVVFDSFVIVWLRNNKTLCRKLNLLHVAFAVFLAEVVIVGWVVFVELYIVANH